MRSNRRSIRDFRLHPITAVLVGGLAAMSAQAQQAPEAEQPQELSPVTITGSAHGSQVASPKFTTDLLNTPQTVSVIPKEIFSQQGAIDLGGVLRNTPGITYNAGENGFATGPANFSIRGFESGDSVFIDGVRDSGNYNRDVFNLEQVEISKGVSSDNGRGGAGGYVNLVTKAPQLGNHISGSASYGFDQYDSDDRMRASVDVNRQFSDSIAARLNLMVQDGGVAGRQVAENKGFGFAPSVAFGLGTPTRASLSYQYLDRDDVPDWGVPGAIVPGLSPYQHLKFHDLRGRVDRSNFYGLASDYDEVTSHSALARIEHDFASGLRLSNQTRWSNTEREAAYTVVGSFNGSPALVAPSRQGFQRENETLSNLTTLRYAFNTGALKHNLSAGLEVSLEEARTGRQFVQLGGNPVPTDIYNPDPNRTLPNTLDMTPRYVDTAEMESTALFVYDTVEFSPQWQATGGLRVERSDTRIRTRATAGGAVPGNEDAHYDRDDTTVSGKLGVVYKPVSHGSIYASYGRSVLPPGAFLSNPDGSRGNAGSSFPNVVGQNNPNSDEQVADNYELGVKWALAEERVTVSAALFRTERSKIAMGPDSNKPLGFTGYGEQVVKGVELGVAGHVTDEWQVFGGLVFLDARRKHGADIDAALSGGDYNYEDGTPATTSTSGERLAFSPKVMANLWSTYRLPIGLTLGGGFIYQGESFVGRPDNVDRVVANGTRGVLPSYVVFNAMAAYELNRNVTLRLNIDNLTNELYARSVNWSARRAELGAPRSVLLSADFRF